MGRPIIVSEPVLAALRLHLYKKYGFKCHPQDKYNLYTAITYECYIQLKSQNNAFGSEDADQSILRYFSDKYERR